MKEKINLIIGITGASGAIYGITLLRKLQEFSHVITHIIITESGRITILQETDEKINDIISLAHYNHHPKNIAANIASGSFNTAGMVIIPCSINTMSKIAYSITDTLLIRAADVTLKEKRKLILVLRETPLHIGHIKNMQKITKIGGIIAPPLNSFYIKPKTIQDLIDYTILRIIDLLALNLNIKCESDNRWSGM